LIHGFWVKAALKRQGGFLIFVIFIVLSTALAIRENYRRSALQALTF
jgi:hypothetical protein